MATEVQTMAQNVANLARQIATQQIADRLDNDAKFATKDELTESEASVKSDIEQQIVDLCNEIAG